MKRKSTNIYVPVSYVLETGHKTVNKVKLSQSFFRFIIN
jgi:hypothetical protein